MKLAQALKQKNRLVGEINKLRLLIARENSRRNDNTSTVSVLDAYKMLNSKRDELIKLKTAIAKANVGVYEYIETMGELKAHIAWFEGLPTQDGEEILPQYGTTPIKYVFNATFKRQDVDVEIAKLQSEINNLQDKIDNYNATTEI